MTEFQSMPFIKTRDFKKYVITNEVYLKSYEKTYIVQLIKAINFKRTKFDTVKFLENIKLKRKRSHKQEAKWYFKLFAELGARYRTVVNRRQEKSVGELKNIYNGLRLIHPRLKSTSLIA